jgi:iron complex outermembrane receptor protein
MRRGALGLDPVVRGLRDTQLGVYVDAARTFPGGPAGMDTPMSHVDPAHVQSMEVITGPYALTWGAGNLSAIRVTTHALPSASAPAFSPRFTTGYDGNLNARELSGALEGAIGADGIVRYSTSVAWRDGEDYTDGNGDPVAARFRSAEARTRVGVRTSPFGTLSVLGSYQAQRDVDYPGRPLDAAYFDTYQVQAEWTLRRELEGPTTGLRLRDVDLLASVYDVDHLMDNDDKPTALPDPLRMPAFATDINTRSGVRVLGARATARFVAPRDWEFEVGGDVYDADHDADRTVDRRDTGVNVRRDLIWGGARIIDAGLFTRVERPLGRARLGMTGRVDFVTADADSASPFFVSEYGTDLASRETNWSGAATLRRPLTQHWTGTIGLGSVVRTAEANERFSDRAAAKRAQTNAEFLGDPNIKPERSTQGDVWLEGRFARADIQINAFVREMQDYITIDSTSLPRAQPGSPPPVFRFINGRARFHGGEVMVSSALSSSVSVGGSIAYLFGEDLTIGEPALGVTPLRGTLSARLAPSTLPWYVETIAHLTAGQTRVATVRGEIPTPGWTTIDLQGGYRLWTRTADPVHLRFGVRNLLDRAYVHHLSALNAFGGGRLYEPGRVLFVRLTVGG